VDGVDDLVGVAGDADAWFVDGRHGWRQVAQVRQRPLRVEVAGVDSVVGRPDPVAKRVWDPLCARWNVRVTDDRDIHVSSWGRGRQVGSGISRTRESPRR
jgi:hypothetical protein